MNKLTITKIAAVAMGLAVAGQVAQAQTLFNVDVGAPQGGAGTSPVYTGQAVLGYSSGDVWNPCAYWDPITLQDSTGSSAAGVTFQMGGMAWLGFWDQTTGLAPTPSALMRDFTGQGSAGTPMKMELHNLPANNAFNLVVYSGSAGGNQGGTISLTDSTYSTLFQTEISANTSRDINDAEGACWVMFTGTTDGTGSVYFQVANTVGSPDGYHMFNGMQLELAPVPEPSSLALCGGGLVLLGLFRRRLSR